MDIPTIAIATPSKQRRDGWTPERRAKQAELIRITKPWLRSTGPGREEGKARSAANALKHGFRGRPFIDRVREERQLVRDAAATIALAKTFLRLAARSISGQRVTVWTGDPDLDRPIQPDRLVKPL